ncbi:hypothetical protein NPIL_685081 [Nephila pilipes]|uniref:Uncharacterized protein n=1 Tax=Nephila pilipes TaxID=299642 RepID=A0A8X6PC56_NEPPI|nr:hypothetical protein NPIL_685081 [Nephila pilipes]
MTPSCSMERKIIVETSFCCGKKELIKTVVTRFPHSHQRLRASNSGEGFVLVGQGRSGVTVRMRGCPFTKERGNLPTTLSLFDPFGPGVEENILLQVS